MVSGYEILVISASPSLNMAAGRGRDGRQGVDPLAPAHLEKQAFYSVLTATPSGNTTISTSPVFELKFTLKCLQ